MTRRAYLALAATLTLHACARSQPYDQADLRAADNWTFRREYPRADRLFNAFDYGHAILSETLLRHPADASVRLEGRERAFIVSRLLRDPPRVPLEERAVAPEYARLVPEAVATFEWAHVLHRQLYDILADPVMPADARARRVRQALAYYASRRDLALSDAPKSMALMEGQPYSLTFRRMAPHFNQLIWSYHWLQMGLYDALLQSDDESQRRGAISATVDRFFALVDDASGAPKMMPMSAAIAPVFSARYPEAAIIFDNLHSLHDVVSDILASSAMSSGEKRSEVLRAISRYRDSTSFTTTRAEWQSMSRAMGVDHMGGAIPH